MGAGLISTPFMGGMNGYANCLSTMRISICAAVVVVALLPSVCAAGNVCFTIRNIHSSRSVVEVLDQVCGTQKVVSLEKGGGAQQICTCEDSVGKASIKTRLQGNQIWTRHEFIRSGDLVNY